MPTVARKANGEMRFTVNLIEVNEQMKTPRYPTKHKEYIFPKAKGAQVISVLDLKDGFWQVILPKYLRKYFAFSIPEGPFAGHYEFNVVT